jgi:hypothetical protein
MANLRPASRHNAWRLGEIDALRIIEEALEQHVAQAHPEEGVPCDLICETCAALLEREEVVGEQIHAL